MRIPRYEFTTSTQMPQGRPILRDQPTMRTPVTRNVSAYLSDPKAGQRDINLETAAAGRGKYVVAAAQKGLMQLGELLAKADAEEQYLNAMSEFKIEIGQNLGAMKGEILSKKVPRLFNGNIEEHMEGVYKESAATFNKWIIQRRDFHAKPLGREARTAFLRATVSEVATAQGQAAAYSRKQHIGWLKGRAWKLIKEAPDHGSLNELEQNDLYKIAMGDLEFAKAITSRRTELAVDHYRYRIATSRLSELNFLRQEIRDRGVDPEGAGSRDTDETVESLKNPEAKWLQGEHWEKLMGMVNDRQDIIIKKREFDQKVFIDNKYIDVLMNPQNYNLDTFKEWAAADPMGRGYAYIDQAGFNTLVQVWDSARNQKTISSDPNAWLDININIEKWDTAAIAENTNLTIQDRLNGIQKRLAWEQGTRRWDSKDHPIHGDLGYRAIAKLERHYGITVGGVTPAYRQRNEAKQELAFKNIYDEIELKLMDDAISDADKPKEAWRLVNEHIAQNTKTDEGGTKGGASAETHKILGITEPIAKGKFTAWEAEHGPIKSVLENGNQEALKALRDDLDIIVTAEMLKQLGIETDLEKVTEEKGSIEAAIDWIGNIFGWGNN